MALSVSFFLIRNILLGSGFGGQVTYPSVFAVYKEMIPVILKQQKTPAYHVKPTLPDTLVPQKVDDVVSTETIHIESDAEHIWIPVPEAAELEINDVIGITHEGERYAIYRLEDGYYASCGKCPHAGAILAKGLVIDEQIECPAHQGRFEIKTGKATASPASGFMTSYVIKEKDGQLFLGIPIEGI
ncbi:MAG: Rieske 2Fe-2S domain-containing protein [Chloroflexi bacterium]|nr:Rieske 2Fe-2S domain-containing protein [Chloroflexota bacterium]